MSNTLASRRVQNLRRSLINQIPRIPNNRISLNSLESKTDTDLFIIYMCWQIRHVSISPRVIINLPVLKDDSRASILAPNIEAFLANVESGSDLNPYLSRSAHRHGYVMENDPSIETTSSWEDKDFLLNVMGFHHFHLGLEKKSNGLIARTNEVLFAHVSRNSFKVIGLFDHTVFDWAVEDHLTPERQKLWLIYDQFQATQIAPGGMAIGGIGGMGITTAGTPMIITQMAINQVRCIEKVNPRLDDLCYVQEVICRNLEFPEKIKLSWRFSHLDFGLFNEPSREFINLLPSRV